MIYHIKNISSQYDTNFDRETIGTDERAFRPLASLAIRPADDCLRRLTLRLSHRSACCSTASRMSARSAYLPSELRGAQPISATSPAIRCSHGAIANNLRLFLCVPSAGAECHPRRRSCIDRPRGWKIYRVASVYPLYPVDPRRGRRLRLSLPISGAAQHRPAGAGLRRSSPWIGWAIPPWPCPRSCSSSSGRSWASGSSSASRGSERRRGLFRIRAGRRRQLVQVICTSPCRSWRPTLAFYAIVELINMLSWVFAYIYVMTLGGPRTARS